MQGYYSKTPLVLQLSLNGPNNNSTNYNDWHKWTWKIGWLGKKLLWPNGNGLNGDGTKWQHLIGPNGNGLSGSGLQDYWLKWYLK